MRLLNQGAARFRRALRATSIAVDPGEDDSGVDDAPPESTRERAHWVMLTHDDLL